MQLTSTDISLLVWIQTSKHRDPTPTIDSIKASDIESYVQVHDDSDWPNFRALQHWWEQQWLAMADLAVARGATHILRLEDDIIVNRHILHNVLTWPALKNESFGYGTLFCFNYWTAPSTELLPAEGDCFVRNSEKVEGGQAQVLPTSLVPKIIEKVPEALEKEELSFDWALSKAACMLRRVPFVHLPGLIDVTPASMRSSLSRHLPADNPETHYSGSKHFAPRWRRPLL